MTFFTCSKAWGSAFEISVSFVVLLCEIMGNLKTRSRHNYLRDTSKCFFNFGSLFFCLFQRSASGWDWFSGYPFGAGSVSNSDQGSFKIEIFAKSDHKHLEPDPLQNVSMGTCLEQAHSSMGFVPKEYPWTLSINQSCLDVEH